MDGLVRVFNAGGAECAKTAGMRFIRVPNTRQNKKTMDACARIMIEHYPETVSAYDPKGDKIEIALNMDVLQASKLSAFATQLKTATAGIKYSPDANPVWRPLPKLSA